MATPALTRFGSDELKRQFLAPSVAGDVVSCIGVSETGGGSDVASLKTTALPAKGEWTSTYSKRLNVESPSHLTLSSSSL